MSTTPLTLLSGSKTVASSATPEAVGTSQRIRAVMIQAKSTNTGDVRVGNSNSQDWRLDANDSVTIAVEDLADVYVDVDVNGEGVNFLAVKH